MFYFPFSNFSLCSACVIFSASSASLAMESCSYSCITDRRTSDRSANLISLFLSFCYVTNDVRLADRSLILPLVICCWHSYMIKEIHVLKSNWFLLPFSFILLPFGFLYFFAGGSMFFLLEPGYLQFFVEIVNHQI